MNTQEVPILFVVFNRPAKTKLSFEAIRKARPKRLFIAADGPRAAVPTDEENCMKTREIVGQVDWDCRVQTLFRDQNSGGSGRGVSSAINWFFDQVEAGIILEDDCVPNLSFFSFCDSMLKRYQADQRVMHISGSNFQFGRSVGDGSYYYSRVINVWGWATWKRAWQHFDYEMKLFPKFHKYNTISHIYTAKGIQKEYIRTFQNAYDNTWKCWDRRWMLAVYANNGVSIVPNTNLVANIGYGEGASAEYYEDDISINMPTGELKEVISPSYFIIDRDADEFYHQKVFTHPPLPKRIKRKLQKIVEHGK